jgi:hypothetical protein
MWVIFDLVFGILAERRVILSSKPYAPFLFVVFIVVSEDRAGCTLSRRLGSTETLVPVGESYSTKKIQLPQITRINDALLVEGDGTKPDLKASSD